MFVLLDVRETGLSSEEFASRLLQREGVAGHLRLSLTVPDASLDEAGRRIVRFARGLGG